MSAGAVRIGDLYTTDVTRIHVLARDYQGRMVCDVYATVIGLDGPNGVLIAKTDDDREVRVPVEVETRPAGGVR